LALASPSEQQSYDQPSLLKSLNNKRILVVGGSGRVGGSVVRQLLKNQARVTIGGRSEQRCNEARSRYEKLWAADLSSQLQFQVSEIGFASLDCSRADSVSTILGQGSFDLVVHTAGPFQGKVDVPNGVLEACVTNRVPYVDVCDDYCTASAAKSRFAAMARDANVPCIISTGCWVRIVKLFLT
jgi:saccharopine dehydrogenase-like NADP-dependent oxidoreductase